MLGFVTVGFSVPRFAGAQANYYAWHLIAGYTYPYQDLPSGVQYPFKIISVDVRTEPKLTNNGKHCRIYLDVFSERTVLASNQVNFDIDPKTLWKTDNGCLLSLTGEPDLNAQVAIVTDDSATPRAVRGSTMDALVFPDFSSPFCRKALMIDPGLQTYTQFLFPTPGAPKTKTASKPKVSPRPKVTPTPKPPLNPYVADESASPSNDPPSE